MPPESDLPAVAPSGELERVEPASGEESGSASGDGPPGRGRDERGPVEGLRLAGLALVAVLGIVTALGVARLLGEGFREAVLVEVETAPDDAVPAYSDAPREAARFFAERDTVVVTVSRDMTVADFLALYHLENHAAARDALREQLGAAEPGDLLRRGDRVSVPLTQRRETPAGRGGS